MGQEQARLANERVGLAQERVGVSRELIGAGRKAPPSREVLRRYVAGLDPPTSRWIGVDPQAI